MRREDVPNTIWDELDDLSTDAILVYLWSFTNPRCGMAGIYRVAPRRIAEGRLGADGRLEAALRELEEHDLVYYRDRVLWCKPRVAGLSTKSVQIAKSIRKDLSAVEGNELVAAFAREYADHEYAAILRDPERVKPEEPFDLASLARASTEPHETASNGEVVNLNRTSVVGDGAGTRAVSNASGEEDDEGSSYYDPATDPLALEIRAKRGAA